MYIYICVYIEIHTPVPQTIHIPPIKNASQPKCPLPKYEAYKEPQGPRGGPKNKPRGSKYPIFKDSGLKSH